MHIAPSCYFYSLLYGITHLNLSPQDAKRTLKYLNALLLGFLCGQPRDFPRAKRRMHKKSNIGEKYTLSHVLLLSEQVL